jgi:cytochrome c oxidase cbb3-type subunit 1/cytochrome c oxidase cbb3-type subunit I/II
LINLWLPIKNKWSEIHNDIGGKFVFAGTIFYAIVCLQGPLQSLPSVQRLTHFTHWVVAHAHIAVFGFAGMIAIGAMYHIIPYVTKKQIFSAKLADFTYWLIIIGLGSMFFGLTAAGLIQGAGWLNGEMLYRILPELHLYMVLRVISGVLIVSAATLNAYNILMTIFKGKELVI